MHSVAGVCHRDIKPQNILVSYFINTIIYKAVFLLLALELFLWII